MQHTHRCRLTEMLWSKISKSLFHVLCVSHCRLDVGPEAKFAEHVSPIMSVKLSHVAASSEHRWVKANSSIGGTAAIGHEAHIRLEGIAGLHVGRRDHRVVVI